MKTTAWTNPLNSLRNFLKEIAATTGKADVTDEHDKELSGSWRICVLPRWNISMYNHQKTWKSKIRA
jgi:hypothetical protein